ncbi:type II toxin-antitoxin system RelE/ParE family toxin [Lysobacter sp. N42]|uniref:type II toxin-antitoxin system RelE/ParE family toxin n=1 Tax=Lysobacter sp. N42 TaxID=2545719 RepID=UPI00104FDDC3|nr:type II toxin-antitoxin system RelE/ParE family toxin [Lysobacter sp. N42]TCZ78547.1 type II toxin-antitoxin system RelE/ParE family toxin [Lysobacter sp. N42]
MRLVYSPEAVQDLVRLRQFIAEKDPAAAARIAAELVGRIEQLLTFPEMGRPVPQSPEPGAVRDFVFGSYVVRYTVHPSALAILRIWHQLERQRSST